MKALAERLSRAAIWYGKHGLPVHPLRPGSKLPLLDAWQKRATIDAARIAQWWADTPLANVGVCTGVGGSVVFDVDPRHGGNDSLHELETTGGELRDTWRARTGNGGQHIHFRHPGREVRNRVGFQPGIDIRGDGGYVVAPPSELEGSREYIWYAGLGPHELELAPLPDWLLALLVNGDSVGNGPRAPESWVRLVREGVAEGERNQRLTELAGHLLRRDVDADLVLELLAGWNRGSCRPPVADRELATAVASIARRERERRRERR